MRQFNCLLSEFYLKSGIIADFKLLVKQLCYFFYILSYREKKPSFFAVFQHINFKNPAKKCLPNRSLYCIVVCGFLNLTELPAIATVKT
jgi:hypothetical protein